MTDQTTDRIREFLAVHVDSDLQRKDYTSGVEMLEVLAKDRARLLERIRALEDALAAVKRRYGPHASDPTFWGTIANPYSDPGRTLGELIDAALEK